MTEQKNIYFFCWNTSQAQDYKADSYDLENYNSVLMFNGCGTFLAGKCYKSLLERKQRIFEEHVDEGFVWFKGDMETMAT